MDTTLPVLQAPSPVLPQTHMSDSTPGAAPASSAPARRAAGGCTLHERLVARHRDVIEAFRVSARSFNSDVDAAQQKRVVLLHRMLAESHAGTLSMITQEQQRLSEQQAEAQAYREALWDADPDVVLPVRTDMNHCSTADDQGREQAMTLMKKERLRLVQLLVEVRDHHRSRVAAIDTCFAEIASVEEARCKHIEASVQDLMASLTRIAVTSTTESQVLAQRILHHTNEQLGGNYLGMQTMAAQLRQRELYKHQHYQRTLVAVYQDTQMYMAQQHITWCITVLRSGQFHRPDERLQSVQAARQLIGAIRSEADGLTRGLREVVGSLEVAHPSACTSELQVCGGSGANGWLRSFEPNVRQPVFVDEDPQAVLEEWQMRVSVLLRHCRARCNELMARVRAEEATRASVAAALAEHTLSDVDIIARPLSEETLLLQRASLAHNGTDKNRQDVSPDEAVDLLDDALHSLTEAHSGVLAMKESTVQSNVWTLCVPAIEKEGQWFVYLVSRAFQRGYSQFCADAVKSAGSMLVSLEGATDLLLASTRGLLGFLRGLYAQWQEKEMDYRDEVAGLELQLRVLEEELRQEETPAAAEARYTAALLCLQSIANAHTRYYEAVRSRVENATADVLKVSQTCVEELSRQVGLSWVLLSSSDECEIPDTPEQELNRTNSTGTPPASTQETVSSAASAPHWCASHGEEFIIDSVTFRFACVTVRSGGDDAATTSSASLEDCDADYVTTAGAAPGADFQQFYLNLLPELQPAQQDVSLFLPHARVSEWKEHLRYALMEWGLSLQRHAWKSWRLHTAAFQADVQHRVAEVLRYHHRRPAAFQATVYEARVRELTDATHRGEKMLSRIAERVSCVQALKQALVTQTSYSDSDEALIREHATLLVKVRDAMSVNAVKALVSRHDALCAQYCAALADRCSEAVHNLERARAVIEEDCAQLLHDRAVELRGSDKGTQLPPDDPVQMRVDHLRTEVQETLTQSLKAVEDEQRTRSCEVESWKAAWTSTVEHSNAELSVFQAVQEGLARLKTQVQTLLRTAATEEAELSAEVAMVVRGVEEASAAPVIDLAAAMHALLKESSSTVSAASNGDGDTPLTAEDLKRRVLHSIEVIKAMQQDRIRAAPACTVLASLDKLRGLLYARGCRLGLLAHTVEMLRVSPMHYVLPVPLGEDEPETVRSRAGGRNISLKAGRRAKDVQGASTTGHTDMPLSTPATYAEQVAQLAVQVQRDAEAAAQCHVKAFPGDMYRRLPGMTDGTIEQFNSAVAALCLAQQERVKSYTTKAIQPFRQRVQELWNTLQATPALLVGGLSAWAMTAILERVEAVLRPWWRFQAHSSEQWRAHRGTVKLSLARQPNSTALTSLTRAEEARSDMAGLALQQTWAWCLREIEEEVGLHVARSWTALHSYSHLLKGLVTPQHLVSTTEVVESGQHRGLRHLLELRAQHERAAAELEGMAGAKKDPRLQDAMPPHRTDTPGTSLPTASKRHANTSVVTAAAAATESAPLAQLSQWVDIELPGLPLNTCIPLSQYNAQRPQTAVAPPMAAAAYVPTAVRFINDGKGSQAHANRRILAGTSSTSSNTNGRKGHATASMDAKAAATAAEVSVPLVVPRAPLVLECVQLLRAAVQLVSAQGNEAAGILSKAFDFYERQEAQWRQTWALTLKDLTTV
ncbi:hypothetical protein, conserved [Leishmania tarentolae]|uniref:DUF4456 domain-containing protein n=1 Tax=Leishmania tarentolae TaxID=5689 RepID=A0A640KFI5_LEITA|nr:hypothetical protein, conserved [Leishmania tarentolae]